MTKVTRILAVAFAVGVVLSGVLIYTTVRDLAAAWSSGGTEAIQPPSQDGTPDEGSTPTQASPVVAGKPWKGKQRISILLMGLDNRDWRNAKGPGRSDTMIVITIDPLTLTAGMLTLPRDLWVEIPGIGYNKINTAHFYGEANKLPGGGPALAMETVELFLGVPIDYYVTVKFTAFERMVDEIGGVDINVKERIRIYPVRGPNEWLDPGIHHLDGARALGYARNRKTAGGDFDRARRQQEVAMAILDKVVELNMIPTLIRKSPVLYAELRAGVRTNLTLEQMVSLAVQVTKIPRRNIHRGLIGKDMAIPMVRADGTWTLEPIPDKIRLLRDEVFSDDSIVQQPVPIGDPAEAAKLEDASLSVQNGSGVEGLASATEDFLARNGLRVVSVGNADRLDYRKTMVIDYTGNPHTTQFLMFIMNLTQSQILVQSIPDSEVDVAVILGADWEAP